MKIEFSIRNHLRTLTAFARVGRHCRGRHVDGGGLAAARTLGASDLWIGTRFLASEAVAIDSEYQQRLSAATEMDTAYLDNLFDLGWPNAPHRVLRNCKAANREAAGHSLSVKRPNEREIIALPVVGGWGSSRRNGPKCDSNTPISTLSALWHPRGVAARRTGILRRCYNRAVASPPNRSDVCVRFR